MNKYALSLAGGALLATTALATGTVSAATIRTAAQTYPATVTAGTTVPAVVTTVGIAAEVFSATSSTVGFGPRHYLIDSGARLQIQSTVSLTVAGAEFDTTFTPIVTIYDQSTTGTLEAQSVTANGAIASGAAVTMFTDRVLISNINNNTAQTYGVIEVSGVVFRQGQALATVGNSVTLSGTIQNAAQTTTLETIDAKAVVTSRNLLDVRVTAGTTLTVSSAATPIFTTLTSSATSATLATVIASTSSAFSTDLSNVLNANSTISTVEVKLTHAVLNDPAVVDVSLDTGAGFITKTPAQFQSGSVTFTPLISELTSGATGRVIRVSFNGTTAISAAAAGTVAVTTTAGGPARTAAVSAGGAAAALNRGGLNTTFNLVQPSTNSFASFIRIANTGGQAGTVTITVRNSATGATLGSFTSASIAAGGSIQVSAAQIELGAGITASSSVSYDITVAGAIQGFAQHIGFSAQTGGLSDLSSFRSGGSFTP